MLETRSQISITNWLKNHSEVKLITRDGSKTYAKAVTETSSTILQVGNRWHIFHQLFEAVKKTIYNLIPSKWTPLSEGEEISADKPAQTLRKSELQRLENEEKRWKRIQQVQSLYKDGYTITAIGKILLFLAEQFIQIYGKRKK